MPYVVLTYDLDSRHSDVKQALMQTPYSWDPLGPSTTLYKEFKADTDPKMAILAAKSNIEAVVQLAGATLTEAVAVWADHLVDLLQSG